MIKDFSDFLKQYPDDAISEIQNNVYHELDQDFEKTSYSSNLEKLGFMQKHYPTRITLKLLEKYHEWLSD